MKTLSLSEEELKKLIISQTQYDQLEASLKRHGLTSLELTIVKDLIYKRMNALVGTEANNESRVEASALNRLLEKIISILS